MCRKCARYALGDACPVCGGKTTTAHPARFSPEDAYGEYRRRLKRLDADKAKAKASANASTNVSPSTGTR